ncbi:MAG: efflux RND transporter periplasmic adaptor subunit [Calditrichaeota bacterium]|nr:MAG: efflux RND transporter periplasmic adaptor subunit [Calditrichota bacterium]
MEMKRKGAFILTALVFTALIAVILAFRIHEKNHPKVFKTNEQLQKEFGVPVEIAVVKKRDLRSEETFTGTIEGYAETMVVSDLTQKVLEMRVKIGDHVSRGDTLAVLDKKSVSNMNLKYDHTVMAYNDAKREFERIKHLYEAGAVTRQAYDKAKLNYEINKANLEAIVSAVFISSPIDGIVTETYVEPGDKIGAGRPVARVVQFDKVKIKIQVSESDIGRLHVGQKCLVRTPSFDRTFSGKISEISLSANPMTRTFEVTVVVPNPDLLLRSGMFATVTVIYSEKADVLAIPKEAVQFTPEGAFTYVVSSDSLVSRRKIATGVFDGQYYEVLSGLQPGEWVVASGQNKIQMEKQKAIIVARAE